MGAAVFLYTLIGIISLCALLGILSHIHGFLRFVFPLVIKRKAYNCVFTIAYFRLLLIMALVLDLFVLALGLSIISVYPEPMAGNFTGTWNGTGEISGTVMLVPSFSLEKTLLATISAGFLGALAAILINRFSSLQEAGYQHLRKKLLPLINRLLCGDNKIVEKAILRLPHTFVPKRSNQNITVVLASMNRHLVH